VVIAIIGLLASVVLLALNSARAKSRDAKRLADMRQIASAMELFFNDRSSYPTTGIVNGAPMTTANMTTAGLVPSYIGSIPDAPQPYDTPGCSSQTENAYKYSVFNSGASYTIGFCLGAQTGGYSGTPHTLSPAGIQ
ncbi:MAG: hypothetical protein COT92_00460, partial [Candidatus Doudnabacteria bacterium CG10_big_fil_rev_8_21_14_0_10_42_18]